MDGIRFLSWWKILYSRNGDESKFANLRWICLPIDDSNSLLKFTIFLAAILI